MRQIAIGAIRHNKFSGLQTRSVSRIAGSVKNPDVQTDNIVPSALSLFSCLRAGIATSLTHRAFRSFSLTGYRASVDSGMNKSRWLENNNSVLRERICAEELPTGTPPGRTVTMGVALW